MRLVVTGQTGMDKATFLKKVGDLAAESGKKLTIYDLDKKAIEERPDLQFPFHLQLPHHELLALRRNAMGHILDEIRGRRDDNIILHLHAIYRNRGIPFAVLDVDQFRDFGPRMCVVLIDDVYRVKARINNWISQMRRQRLMHHPTERISLRDIMEWRAEEIMVTEILARSTSGDRSVPYVIALRHGPRLIYDLMFESQEALGGTPGKRTAYTSFPISKLFKPAYADLAKEVNDFRTRLKNESNFIIFDPWTIDERKLLWALEENPSADNVSITDEEGKTYSFPRQEVFEIKDHLATQIPVRDYALVDQSDLTIAYRPAMSGGVRDEIAYAKKAGKAVYAVWPSSDEPPGDFEAAHLDYRFESIDELIARLRV